VSHPDGTVELSSRQESRIPSPGKHAAFRHRKARADSGDAAPRKDSGEGHRRGHRQELERDVVGRVTDHRGEVERGEKEDRKNPKEEQESDHDCACEPGLAKVRQVEHRCFVRTLNADKTGERDDADDEKDDDGRRAITQRLTEDDREGERAETGATRQEAGDVEWNRLRIGALAITLAARVKMTSPTATLNQLTSAPPITGPSASARPETAPQTPSARARSCFSG